MKTASIGAALTVFTASAIDAGAWCPSTDGATISCSNCTRDLTCNYQGAVTITGDNVTLNGGGNMLYGSSSHGINVLGANANISNLLVDGAAINGIYYGKNGTAILDNVTVNASGGTGVAAANSNIVISFLDATQNGLLGAGMGKWNGFGDISYSNLEGNVYHGWNSFWNSYGFNMDNFNYLNGQDGANDIAGDGGVYARNYFWYNGRHGLYLEDRTKYRINLVGNRAEGNQERGCMLENVNEVIYSDNNWHGYMYCHTF